MKNEILDPCRHWKIDWNCEGDDLCVFMYVNLNIEILYCHLTYNINCIVLAMFQQAKEEGWKKISEDFNAETMTGVSRTLDQLRACWNNMKKTARKKIAEDKVWILWIWYLLCAIVHNSEIVLNEVKVITNSTRVHKLPPRNSWLDFFSANIFLIVKALEFRSCLFDIHDEFFSPSFISWLN